MEIIMKNMTLERITEVCDGVYYGSETDKTKEITGAVIDSRQVEPVYQSRINAWCDEKTCGILQENSRYQSCRHYRKCWKNKHKRDDRIGSFPEI